MRGNKITVGFNLKIRKMVFTAVCTNPTTLRYFSPNVIHGALGWTLGWLSGEINDNRRSLSRENLIFGEIYRTVFKSDNKGKEKRYGNKSKFNPYIVECKSAENVRFKQGDELEFSIVFVGDFACSHSRELAMAIKLMLEGDFGGSFDCFALKTVTEDSNGGLYYENGTYYDNPPCWEWCDRDNIDTQISKISIVFDEQSPVCLRRTAISEMERLPFPLFMKMIMIRTEHMCVDHSGGEQVWENDEALVNGAESVEMTFTGLARKRIQIPKLKGSAAGIYEAVYGEIMYAGDLTRFLPYINLCSVLHIGYATSLMGLGGYRWRILE
jgi:hypothetical protein